MKNYDFWKDVKIKNKNQIILILSGIFYKSFSDDAKFLSDKFGFKIKVEGGYESIGFPKSVLEKYLKELKDGDFGYIVFDNKNEKIIIINDFFGNKKLDYQEERLNFIQTKDQKNDFKSFLKDLSKLIEKYS